MLFGGAAPWRRERHRPRRVPRRRHRLRHQARRHPRPGRRGHGRSEANVGGRGVHDQQDDGGAGRDLAPATCTPPADGRPPSSSTAATPTRPRGRRGSPTPARMGELLAAGASAAHRAEVLVCSTGLIGIPLPMATIEAGIPKLAAALSDGIEAGADAAEAIRTTDSHRKETVVGRPGIHGRRHGQGGRDARAQPGDHARRAHHRRRGRPGHAAAGPDRGQRPDVQPVHRRRLHVDQRHRDPSGQRRGRARRPRPT